MKKRPSNARITLEVGVLCGAVLINGVILVLAIDDLARCIMR